MSGTKSIADVTTTKELLGGPAFVTSDCVLGKLNFCVDLSAIILFGHGSGDEVVIVVTVCRLARGEPGAVHAVDGGR